MTFRKSVLLFLSLSMIATLVACSSSSTPAVTIAATTGTPQSAPAGSQFGNPLVVTVMKGSTAVSGATVTFTAPAQTGASGTFAGGVNTATTDASGVATSAALTANTTAGAYTVTASVTGATATATFSLTNTAALTLTPGNYVFSLSGADANASFYSVSGVFTVASDGATISGGEQDFTDYVVGPVHDKISGGSVALSTGGTHNLVITLTTADTSIGVHGTETLVATPGTNPLPSISNALVVEYDTWATSNGTLDAQTATSLPACSATATSAAPCGYAFLLAGLDPSSYGLVIGGVITEDGPGTISGTNSIFDANDDFSGFNFAGETIGASTVVQVDANGQVEFTLVPTDTLDFGASIVLIGYVVDANRIRLVETADSFGGFTGGTALVQANPGTISSISGNRYVLSLAGGDANGAFQVAGLLTAGATTFSGYVNYNDLTGTGVQAPDPVYQTKGDTYTVESTGRVSIPGMTDGTETGANFNQYLYLDGNGNALALTLDSTDLLSGIGYLQTGGGLFTAASFDGTYAMNAGGANMPVGDEYEFAAVGPVAADGVGTLAGAVDLNWINTPDLTADFPVSGNFTFADNGVFTSPTSAGSGITGLDLTTPANDDAFNFYLVDTTRVVAIETDPNQLTLGYFLLQQTPGGGFKNKK